MKLKEIAKELDLEVLSGKGLLNRDVTGGYASDMLSDVLANSGRMNLWVTMQIHHNILAVATVKDLAGIIISNARSPEKEIITKAEEKNIPIMVSRLSTYRVVGRLYELGIR